MKEKNTEKINKFCCQKVLTWKNKRDIIIFAAENGGKLLKRISEKIKKLLTKANDCDKI